MNNKRIFTFFQVFLLIMVILVSLSVSADIQNISNSSITGKSIEEGVEEETKKKLIFLKD